MSSIRWRLSAMMFLQYAIWGAWAPVLWPYMTDVKKGLGMSDPQAALIFSLLPLACILAPFTGGQIADRWVSTEKFLAAAHLLGGIFLIWASHMTVFGPLLAVFAVYTLVFAPTLALTNSLAFHHLSDEKDFGIIRVFGTIGWICAGLALTLWRGKGFLLTYALALLGSRAYLATAARFDPAAWAEILGSSGEARRVIAGNLAIFSTVGTWLTWFVLPLAHFSYLIQRLLVNPLSLAAPFATVEELMAALRGRRGSRYR